MECAARRQLDPTDEIALASVQSADPEPRLRHWSETEIEFYTRRALEEHRLATRAPTAAAAAAHLYLAASYSTKMAEELSRQAELEKLALRIA